MKIQRSHEQLPWRIEFNDYRFTIKKWNICGLSAISGVRIHRPLARNLYLSSKVKRQPQLIVRLRARTVLLYRFAFITSVKKMTQTLRETPAIVAEPTMM